MNRVKRLFNANHGMSLDRPRAERMMKSTSEETSFHERFGTELPGLSVGPRPLQKIKTCNNSQAPDHWPSLVDLTIRKTKTLTKATRKTRAAGPAVHSLPVPGRPRGMTCALDIQKLTGAYVIDLSGSEKTGETRAPAPTQGASERKCQKRTIT